MSEPAIRIDGKRRGEFIGKVAELLPNGGNLNLCLTCGLCVSGCPAAGLEDMDPRKLLRMAAMGLDEEITSTPWVWMCTMCFRCSTVCPMQVDIPSLVYQLRASWPRDKKPKGIIGSCNQALRTEGASAVGISSDDFRFVVGDVLEEVRESQPGFADLQAPIDKKGAFFFVNQNSREPQQEPDEMVPLWKILHLAGADWTYGSTGWGAENYCMFAAEDDHWREVLQKQADGVKKLGCSSWINIECGHSFYSIWAGFKRFHIDPGVTFDHVVNWYARWIREGKLRPSSDWNKDLKLRFTVQDPCMAVRKSMGNSFAEELRFVVKACVGEENFVDMFPNRSNNYCCGGGGGFLQSGYKDARLNYGRVKVGQIQATKADYVITPCHNCHAQIEELSEHYHGDWRTVHLWTILCLSLGVLGENERSYLGPDLAEVGLG
ncbi:(Fe-S)-binding protein [Desulfolutivibrio sulfoxidireducens]|uniref:(Fe-S)-binding protein n=1 Tax=Desulfolutivibrio sulfoxidireducens TaxID=2773299 RepID=UPI00159D2A60|nr:(Fe-S)-binding protein [Desulfolutivibrio sulfoxidireducens]QLA20377.1 oxidoreductase [Desulfolutivibrio sulfoxidireducens]